MLNFKRLAIITGMLFSIVNCGPEKLETRNQTNLSQNSGDSEKSDDLAADLYKDGEGFSLALGGIDESSLPEPKPMDLSFLEKLKPSARLSLHCNDQVKPEQPRKFIAIFQDSSPLDEVVGEYLKSDILCQNPMMRINKLESGHSFQLTLLILNDDENVLFVGKSSVFDLKSSRLKIMLEPGQKYSPEGEGSVVIDIVFPKSKARYGSVTCNFANPSYTQYCKAALHRESNSAQESFFSCKATEKSCTIKQIPAPSSVYLTGVCGSSESTFEFRLAPNENKVVEVCKDEGAEIKSLGISHANVTLKKDDTFQLALKAYFKDGSSELITNLAQWSTSSDKIAAVSAKGLIKALSSGNAVIKALYKGHSASMQLVVKEDEIEPFIKSLHFACEASDSHDMSQCQGKVEKISCNDDSNVQGNFPGSSKQLHVIAFWSNCTITSLDPRKLSWSSSKPKVADFLDHEKKSGVISFIAPGDSYASARLVNSEIKTEKPLLIEVSEAKLEKLFISGDEIIIEGHQNCKLDMPRLEDPNGQFQASGQQFAVWGFYNDCSLKDLTEKATWKSSKNELGYFKDDKKGYLYFVNSGMTEISASVGDLLANKKYEIEYVDVNFHVQGSFTQVPEPGIKLYFSSNTKLITRFEYRIYKGDSCSGEAVSRGANSELIPMFDPYVPEPGSYLYSICAKAYVNGKAFEANNNPYILRVGSN